MDQMLNLRKDARAQIKQASDHIAKLDNQIKTGTATLHSTRQALDRTDDELAKARKALADARRPRKLTAAFKKVSVKGAPKAPKVEAPKVPDVTKESDAVKALTAKFNALKNLIARQPRGAAPGTP